MRVWRKEAMAAVLLFLMVNNTNERTQKMLKRVPAELKESLSFKMNAA